MQVFKITYINNRILSVKPADHIALNDSYSFEASESFIMFAHVKAKDADEAEVIGNEIKGRFLKSKK